MYQVVVAGSINMDVVVSADRHPAVGETVRGYGLNYFPGGKGANQAVAAARLGANTCLLGKLGTDAFAEQLDHFLRDQNIDLTHVLRTEIAPTGTALITVADSDNTIVVVPGANDHLLPDDVTSVEINKGDLLISQFEIPDATIEAFFRHGKERQATTILNPAPAKELSDKLLELVDILIVNESELSFLTNETLNEDPEAGEIARLARKARIHDDQVIVVTLGRHGLLAILGEREIPISGRSVDVVDTTGAGDCFVGAFAGQLSIGSSLDKALEYANAAASVSVQRMGAGISMPTGSDVTAALRQEVTSL